MSPWGGLFPRPILFSPDLAHTKPLQLSPFLLRSQPWLGLHTQAGIPPAEPRFPPGSGGRERRRGNGAGGSAAAPWVLGAGGQHTDISRGLPPWRPVVGVVGSPVYRRAD